MESEPPSDLASGRTIDLSIQFTMFWMPLLVLAAWWADRPLFLLFGERECVIRLNDNGLIQNTCAFDLADFFEVAVVIGACFLVNSVTDDAKTNWAEGLVLLSFYFMVVGSLISFYRA
jgi:Ca2+:H+ antiporter